MRLILLKEYNSALKSILFMNGGGQIPYSRNSKIVKYFSSYDYNLFAVELPGHGKSMFSRILSESEFITHYRNEITKLITDYQLKIKALVGFSLGGLLAMKFVEFNLANVEYLIVYGCGFGIGKNEASKFEYYTSEAFFVDMNWGVIMKKNHGDGWSALQQSMNNVMRVGSTIFSNPRNFNSSTKIVLFIGDEEELFNVDYNRKLILSSNNHDIETQIVPNTSHFEYTSKSWSEFCSRLDEFILAKQWFD